MEHSVSVIVILSSNPLYYNSYFNTSERGEIVPAAIIELDQRLKNHNSHLFPIIQLFLYIINCLKVLIIALHYHVIKNKKIFGIIKF